MSEMAPYGTWASPSSAADVAGEDGRPGWLGRAGGDLWWTESRPAEQGRVTLMRSRGGRAAAEEVLPAPWNVRSRVIEYGGQPWAGRGARQAGPVIVFALEAELSFLGQVLGFEPRDIPHLTLVT